MWNTQFSLTVFYLLFCECETQPLPLRVEGRLCEKGKLSKEVQ
jgi:hypothetical protein